MAARPASPFGLVLTFFAGLLVAFTVVRNLDLLARGAQRFVGFAHVDDPRHTFASDADHHFTAAIEKEERITSAKTGGSPSTRATWWNRYAIRINAGGESSAGGGSRAHQRKGAAYKWVDAVHWWQAYSMVINPPETDGGSSALAVAEAPTAVAKAAETKASGKKWDDDIVDDGAASKSSGSSKAADKPAGEKTTPGSKTKWKPYEPEDRSTLMCNAHTQVEYSGELAGNEAPGAKGVKVWASWGGDKFQRDTADGCCEACRAHKPADNGKKCNIWVWCGKTEGCFGQPFGACWLKIQPHPTAPGLYKGPEIPWTSGALHPPRDKFARGKDRRYHVAMTSNGNIYVNWQARVAYYFYLKHQAADGPDSPMGGFTRILHGPPDSLMDTLPTAVVKPLDNEYGFVVLSRPYAFVQWLTQYEIDEEFVFMMEPDHLLLKPLPNVMIGRTAAAFPFFYISPQSVLKEGKAHLIRKFAGPLTDEEILYMDPVGNSPNFIHKDDLLRIAPLWANLTVAIKTDKEADAEWGWVQEMWAYTIAAKIVGVRHDLYPELAAQPPWDTSSDNFYIIHYTYGCDYTLNGTFTPGKVGPWRFDKRSYSGSYLVKALEPPPKATPEIMHTMIGMFNEATSTIPHWEMGDTPPMLKPGEKPPFERPRLKADAKRAARDKAAAGGVAGAKTPDRRTLRGI